VYFGQGLERLAYLGIAERGRRSFVAVGRRSLNAVDWLVGGSVMFCSER
jgi:hypothetical protein